MFSVLMPIGPGDAEVRAAADTLDSIRFHEPDARIILVDDSPSPRDLIAELGSDSVILRTVAWGSTRPDPFTAMTIGTIEGLRAAHGDFAVKLDTDALVIAPFADKLSAALDLDVGVAGSYSHGPNGARRDWSMWRPRIRRTWAPLRTTTGPLPRLLTARDARARWRILRAVGAPGAHCQGGAYAVNLPLLERRALLDWRPWAQTNLGEDVVVGLLCQAAGLRFRGLAGRDEVFGVTWQGLPDRHERLAERGYSIIHSVKSDPRATEAEIRTYFRARREGRSGG